MSIQKFGDDLLGSLLAIAVDAVPGGIGAGVSVAGAAADVGDCAECGAGTPEHDHDGRPRSIAAVGVAAELDAAQWAQALGPLWDAFRTGQLVSRPGTGENVGSEDPIGLSVLRDVSGKALKNVRGAVFSAGEWGGELPVVLSVYLDRAPDATSHRVIDRWEPLVSQALSMVEYCSGQERVAEQMLQMTQYRRVIEQAKGMVMGALGSDADTAFGTLARASQHFNVRLRNLAIALVEHVGGGGAEHPSDPDLVVRPSQEETDAAQRVWAALSTSTAILPPQPVPAEAEG